MESRRGVECAKILTRMQFILLRYSYATYTLQERCCRFLATPIIEDGVYKCVDVKCIF